MSGFHLIDPSGLRDPGEAGALEDGHLQVLPASFWATFSQAEISMFCLRHGFYCVPTCELVEWLRTHIAGRRAIEIGSGNGVLASALQILATDSRQQERPEIRAVLQVARQTPVKYGAKVERLDAEAALRKYKPEVIIGAWVTHRYNASEHWREGNVDGIDEKFLIHRAEYINVGHTNPHKHKPAWALFHAIHFPDWLVSRAFSEGKNYIATWQKGAQ